MMDAEKLHSPVADDSKISNVESVCNQFKSEWNSGTSFIEDFLKKLGQPSSVAPSLTVRLIQLDIELRRQQGESPQLPDYESRFNELAPEVLNDLLMMPAPQVRRNLDTPFLPARYRVSEQIGRGGIGSVWRVHDRLMNRPLAAKVLLPKYKHNRAANERLIREALLAGSLQHPGIPPIYEKGELLSGSSFFTMKLVEGKTLEELLKQRANPHQDRQNLLNIFRQIAEAVGYAHSQGAIHRDLKPGNVMVGEFGEVQIMDWGMAKQLDPNNEINSLLERSDVEFPTTLEHDWTEEQKHDTANVSIDSSLAFDSKNQLETQQGEVFGTPSYMPPEQAVGDLNKLDERADVFSLGAILFELLVGQRLYQDVEVGQLVEAAADCDLKQSIETLRSMNIDGELVELCTACLQAEPNRRPENGQQVAKAISVYLSNVDQRLRQAEVDRSSAEVRVLEEKKRRHTFVRMAAIIGLVGCIGAVGIGWQWSQANRNLKEAERLNAARKVYFSKSLEAIDKMLTRVGFETLANVPGMSELRRELLQEALGFYQEFVKVADASTRIDDELAKVNKLAGTTQGLLGDHPDAKTSYLKAIEILNQLKTERPDDETVSIELASCHALLGNTFHEMGQPESAAEELKFAVQMLSQGLAAVEPAPFVTESKSKWLIELAQARLFNSVVLKSTEGNNPAIEEMKRADKDFTAIPDEFSNDRIRVSHARCLANLSRHLRALKNLDSANGLEARAIAIMEEVVARNPGSPAYRNTLVNFLQAKNGVLANQGYIEEAAIGFEQQLEIQKELVKDFPNLPYLQNDLVRTYALYGAAIDALGRNAPAIELLEEGIEIGEQLVQQYPQTVNHLRELSFIYKNAAIARRNSRAPEQQALALDEHKRSYELNQNIVDLAPENADYRFELAMAAQVYGRAVFNNLELSIAEASKQSVVLLKEAESIFASLLAKNADNADYQFRLANVRADMARALSKSEPQEAAAVLDLAADGFEELIVDLPDDPQFRLQLARTHDEMAMLYQRLGQTDKWEEELRKAHLTMRQTVEKFGENARMIEYVSVSQNRLGHCLKTLGMAKEAEDLFRASLKMRMDYLALDPDNERLVRKAGSVKRNLAWLFAFWFESDEQDLQLAFQYAQEAVQDDPEECELWTCLAYIQHLKNDPQAFENALSQVESADGFDRMTRAAIRAIHYHSMGEVDLAKEELATAEELSQTEEVQENWPARLVLPESFKLIQIAKDRLKQN